jgi:hypothetical protein
MSKEQEGQSLREVGNRRKRRRRLRTFIIILILLIIAAAAGILLFRYYHRTYSSYQIKDSIENTEENLAGYLEYQGAVVRYSKDGAVAVGSGGELLWNGSYEMLEPIADVCGKYVAIADRGGKKICIFNDQGLAGSLSMQYNISKVKVASQGVVAVLMEEEDISYIRLFDKEGKLLGEKIINVIKGGYPMDIALSKDGKKLVTVFVSVNKGKLQNTVIMYNFGEVGKNRTDNFAGSFMDYDDIIVPKVTFLDNDTVCVFKENGLELYSMPELPELITKIPAEQKIKSILYSSKYAGVVLESENSDKGRLFLYNLEGKKVLEQNLDMEYDKIFISGDEIIMHNELACKILKTNGTVKFKGMFTTDISALYPVNHLDKYLLVTSEEIIDLQLVE